MTRLFPYILVFALGAGAALGLVSCGSSDQSGLLPGNTASEIVTNLDRIKMLNAEGSCTEAETAVDQVRLQVADLPAKVDPQLRRALAGGAARLQEVTAGCVETTVASTFDTLSTPTEETTQKKTKTRETTKSEPTKTTTSQPTNPTTTTQPTTTSTQTQTTTSTSPPTTGGGSGGVGPGKTKRGR